jgi:glycosyltransferase involved in cell wall biosynthesis
LSNKLNVLFLCGWYPSRVSPTNGDFIQRHAEAVSLNHKVTVIHITTDSKLNKNIEITSEIKNAVKTHVAFLKSTKNPIKKIFLYIKAFYILLQKDTSFNVVHLNELFPFGIFTLYLKWFKKIPFIISEHFTGYHYPRSKQISILQKLISIVITKNASFVCPVSNDLKKSMLKLGLKGNYKRVPNVVNTDVFYPKKQSNSVFTFTHISNMNNNHKNIEGILRVVKKLENELDNFRFKLIGENSEFYIPFAKKLNIDLKKTIFINQIPHKEVATNLKDSNLFILFSNYENLPCVILESFSCGTPVISTNVGGINEYFPKDFGFLINTKDEEALLQKILEVYSNFKTDKEKMYNYVENNFSKITIANQFTELYNFALN